MEADFIAEAISATSILLNTNRIAKMEITILRILVAMFFNFLFSIPDILYFIRTDQFCLVFFTDYHVENQSG